jgi:hypothetical protein
VIQYDNNLVLRIGLINTLDFSYHIESQSLFGLHGVVKNTTGCKRYLSDAYHIYEE